ncbi:2'-5' RNA ligase family protein [Streptomyces sp. NBC_01498]|uniref:2'-5' RNA ligase family protein n=1 Tax=Streptomyces sp. NBC_01498 TaxID=2975870 RepID=UPI002E7AE1F0|nr:hypothetical protein [Streptomyces sp. NBC_01498]WTL27652.1 2'-5' RNA ligase family protein [Streptomyces sp. NBC_01498]
MGVNFPVTAHALEACSRFNAQLFSLTGSMVAFGPGGNSSPHVTIAMGTLRSGGNLRELEDAVAGALSSFPDDDSPPVMAFGPVYRESLTGHYIFADVRFSERVQKWRKETQSALAPLFVEPARTTDVPHLTLGHVSVDIDRVDAFINTSRPPIPACGIASVDISVSGSKGVKQSVLRSFDLAF